ncbi:hypothetical protein ABEF93_001897 [Exophiala dermatitidis]
MDATSPTPTVVARGANNNSDSDLGTSTTTGTGTGSGGRKHAKGLSLNLPLPILVPPQLQMSASVSQSPSQSLSQSQSPSPRTRWSYQGPILLDSPARSSHASASPIRVSTSSSSFAADERSIGTGSGSDSSWMRRNKTSGAGARTRTSADFLTLLAAQERRVLELREELQKAEADLLGLKKQWASYEANKKREEVKHVKKLEALPLDDVVSSRSPTSTSGGGGAFDDDEEERRRRRALVERSVRMTAAGVNNDSINGDGEEEKDGHCVNGANAGAITEQLGRRTSTKKPRVFQGGRHTRTLSLLSPTSAKYRQQQGQTQAHGQEDGTGTAPAKSPDAMVGNSGGLPSDQRTDDPVRNDESDARRISDDSSSRSSLSLTRMTMTTTLDGLISGADSLQQLGFGKTYKELATAHRRSLPPVAADLLVKQGKQVYEGVREGLWTFWEDIRQATVGEEGINGPATQQQPAQKRSVKRENGETGPKKRGSSTSNSTATATSATRTQRNRNHGPERSRDRDGQSAPESKSKEPVSSFWREFGLETPHKQQVQSRSKRPDQTPTQGQKRGDPTKSDKTRHAQQKSVTSTDSSTPPSLIPDLNDDDNETGINRDDEDDTPWDAWDSPVSTRVTDAVASVLTGRSADSDNLIATTDPGNGGNNSLAAAASPSSTGQLLPWPEIAKPEKLATSDQQGLKLTRTVSDLMKEWDG